MFCFCFFFNYIIFDLCWFLLCLHICFFYFWRNCFLLLLLFILAVLCLHCLCRFANCLWVLFYFFEGGVTIYALCFGFPFVSACFYYSLLFFLMRFTFIIFVAFLLTFYSITFAVHTAFLVLFLCFPPHIGSVSIISWNWAFSLFLYCSFSFFSLTKWDLFICFIIL